MMKEDVLFDDSVVDSVVDTVPDALEDAPAETIPVTEEIAETDSDVVSSDTPTVSGNDVTDSVDEAVPFVSEFTDSVDTVNMETVSGNDTVSGNSVYNTTNNITYEVVSYPTEETYTLWEKPLNEYSVSEGLLLLIFCLLFVMFIKKLWKGGSNKWLI